MVLMTRIGIPFVPIERDDSIAVTLHENGGFDAELLQHPAQSPWVVRSPTVGRCSDAGRAWGGYDRGDDVGVTVLDSHEVRGRQSVGVFFDIFLVSEVANVRGLDGDGSDRGWLKSRHGPCRVASDDVREEIRIAFDDAPRRARFFQHR